MDSSSQDTTDKPGARMAPPIAELEVVRVIRDVESEGYSVPKNSCGTVLAIYGRGTAYAVEITGLPGGTEVVTLLADQIERIR